MHYCCVKYCQNKLTNARLFQFLKFNSQFTAELQDISRKRIIAWFKAIKFKNTNVSNDSIDDCRICESHFKSGKWLNAALVFYKALHFILPSSKMKIFRRACSLFKYKWQLDSQRQCEPRWCWRFAHGNHNHHKVIFHLVSWRKGNCFMMWFVFWGTIPFLYTKHISLLQA